jgi:MYXO-CTERM domain-containing protein
MATAQDSNSYSTASNDGPPSWTKGAAAAGVAGGAMLVLRRRRKGRQAKSRARELEAAAANRARGALQLVQAAAQAAPALVKSLPERTKDLSSKADDLSNSARTGVRSWRKDIGDGKWQAWAATVAGAWLLMRLAERRQMHRLTKALTASRA